MQVVEKAHPHMACAFTFVGVEATGKDGDEITREQRQAALKALAEDITDVVEWPCHWRVSPKLGRKLVSKGHEELERCGAGCCLLNVTAMAKSSPRCSLESFSEEEPHPLWATAAFWKGPLQGRHLRCQLLSTHKPFLYSFCSLDTVRLERRTSGRDTHGFTQRSPCCMLMCRP